MTTGSKWGTEPYPDYAAQVNASISFSGQNVDFFAKRKSLWLRKTIAQCFGGATSLACLDVGCGIGLLHQYLEGSVHSLTGVDISSEAIADAASRNPQNTYLVYDGHLLPFADSSFDICLAVCVLHHLQPTSWRDFVAEMARVTRPHGAAVVIEHNPFNPLTRYAVSRCAFDDDATLVHSRTIRRLFAQADFLETRVHHFFHIPFDAGWAEQFDNLLAFVPFGVQYAVVARKNT